HPVGAGGVAVRVVDGDVDLGRLGSRVEQAHRVVAQHLRFRSGRPRRDVALGDGPDSVTDGFVRHVLLHAIGATDSRGGGGGAGGNPSFAPPRNGQRSRRRLTEKPI